MCVSVWFLVSPPWCHDCGVNCWILLISGKREKNIPAVQTKLITSCAAGKQKVHRSQWKEFVKYGGITVVVKAVRG